jgi:hypothetical protein
MVQRNLHPSTLEDDIVDDLEGSTRANELRPLPIGSKHQHKDPTTVSHSINRTIVPPTLFKYHTFSNPWEISIHQVNSRFIEILSPVFPQVHLKSEEWNNSNSLAKSETRVLYVVIVMQQSQCSMLDTGGIMQQERDTLLDQFYQFGNQFVQVLKSFKAWADFTDPATGYPVCALTMDFVNYKTLLFAAILNVYESRAHANHFLLLTHKFNLPGAFRGGTCHVPRFVWHSEIVASGSNQCWMLRNSRASVVGIKCVSRHTVCSLHS